MIQILGLREYTDPITRRLSKKHAFFKQGWKANSVEEVFSEIDMIIAQVPEEERHNIYFTVAHCKGEEPRDFSHQSVIPLDIDNVDLDKIPETVQCVVDTLSLDYGKTGVSCSGNGLQLFVKYEQEFNKDFFKQKKVFFYHSLVPAFLFSVAFSKLLECVPCYCH